MTRKQKRLTVILVALVVLGLAAALMLFALRQEIVFFRTPSDLASEPVAAGSRFRLGGLVEKDSLVTGNGTTVLFRITDTIKALEVRYDGILPDLFREGQGVVAEGILAIDGVFLADSVLAKHDENYMPKEVSDSLKSKGVWQGNTK